MIDSKKQDNALIVLDNSQLIDDQSTYVSDTFIYKISRILKSLQYTTKYNVIRIWNDSFIENPSEENGRLIVQNLIESKK